MEMEGGECNLSSATFLSRNLLIFNKKRLTVLLYVIIGWK